MVIAQAMQKFWENVSCKIPQTVGAIDEACIEANSLSGDSKVDYFNRKQKYSSNTQAVVGGNVEFIDITTGCPRSIHDGPTLRDSTLYFQPKVIICSLNIEYWIICLLSQPIL